MTRETTRVSLLDNPSTNSGKVTLSKSSARSSASFGDDWGSASAPISLGTAFLPNCLSAARAWRRSASGRAWSDNKTWMVRLIFKLSSIPIRCHPHAAIGRGAAPRGQWLRSHACDVRLVHQAYAAVVIIDLHES